jgi:HD-like signal output (HDOD) protein
MPEVSAAPKTGYKVLFVDDEPNVLAGLRRMLRPYSGEWEVTFAIGPEEALSILDKSRFDVVVTDMRMPCMDGGQLLTHVRDRSPDTVRIILSGQADRSAGLKAAGVAHQFLNKPCEPEALRAAIARAHDLAGRLVQTGLRSALGGLDRLPSPSQTLTALNGALAQPDVVLDEVVGIIGSDLGISSKTLQLVNSAFFGLPRQVNTLREAVSYLGLENLRGLVAAAETFRLLADNEETESVASRLEAHSAGVLRLARHISQCQHGNPQIFVGALLHDVGLLAVASLLPDSWAALVGSPPATGTVADEAERRILGATHGEIGAYLLELWGLPDFAVEIVTNHHRRPSLPVLGGGNDDGSSVDVATAIYIADGLMSETDLLPCHVAVDEAMIEELGIESVVGEWRQFRDREGGAVT